MKNAINRQSWLPNPTGILACQEAESTLLELITQRATAALLRPWRGDVYLSEIREVLTDCHRHGCPLRLRDMLGAPLGDLLHAVVGILQHWDEHNHHMRGCFVPRFFDAAAAAEKGGQHD